MFPDLGSYPAAAAVSKGHRNDLATCQRLRHGPVSVAVRVFYSGAIRLVKPRASWPDDAGAGLAAILAFQW